MKLSTTFRGDQTPFEGDRTLLLQSLPAGAQVTQATVTLTPRPAPGQDLFVELILFTGDQGTWGATKVPGSGALEVDFHTRRTLASIQGTNLTDANLQVDVGGLYVEINDKGAVKAPDDDLFELKVDNKLPGLTVSKFKLTRPSFNLDASQVTIRSAPSNLSLRLGSLPPFWSRPGELSQLETSPDFAQVLQAFLAQAEVEDGFYQVPLTVHSDTIARLDLDVEINYLQQQPALPDGLEEVTLSYDYASLPKNGADTLQVQLPAGAVVVPELTTARVIGAFEASRIAYGPSGEITPAASVPITPGRVQAQPFYSDQDLAATAVDLLLSAVTRRATLNLNLVEDADGKPWSQPLLSRPVTLQLDHDIAGTPTWISAALPSEYQFKAGQGYWLVLQSVEGEAAWSADLASSGPGMQFTADGGLSYRAAGAPNAAPPLAGIYRLRYDPGQYQVPVDLQIGAGEQAIRLGLDRFQPLGRLDFNLDFPEVAAAFNQYLSQNAPAACPLGEHLDNGDVEAWDRVGDQIMPPRPVPTSFNPVDLAVSPDGAQAYVASSQAGTALFAHLEILDTACNSRIDQLPLGVGMPTSLALSPDGERLYLAVGQNLVALAASDRSLLAGPITLASSARFLSISPDGGQLYLGEYAAPSGSAGAESGSILIYNTGQMGQTPSAISLGSQQEPVAAAASPDGSRLYVAVNRHDSDDAGELQIYNPQTRQMTAASIPLGADPRGLALSPDGLRAVIASRAENALYVVNLESGNQSGAPVPVGAEPVDVAFMPDGAHFVSANSGENSLSLVDLRLRTVQPISLASPAVGVVVSPQGDRIYALVRIDTPSTNQLVALPVGALVPSEWTLTAGQVTPYCLPDPFHRAALLGMRGNAKKPSLASGLSQVTPVQAGCGYQFSFWGLASATGALAEIFWLSPECGLLRADQLPIQPLSESPSVVERGGGVELAAIATDQGEPQLVLHRLAADAPDGASLVEVRFSTPSNVAALVDRVSLQATDEVVLNGDLQQLQDGRLASWTLTPANAPGVVLVSAPSGLQLKNAGASPAELAQLIPFDEEKPFSLLFEGAAAISTANPRLELRWRDAAGNPISDPAQLEVTPAGADQRTLNSASPEGTAQFELALVVPPGASLSIRRISLRPLQMQSVPVTFIAQAPGDLTISDWQVAYDLPETPAPRPSPSQPLCPPTAPGRLPGEAADGCYCPCCQAERDLVEPALGATRAGRPALVGNCEVCGAELSQPGGRPASGTAVSARLARPVAEAPRVLRPAPAVLERRIAVPILALAQPVELVEPVRRAEPRQVELPALTAVEGIGEERARLLAETGIPDLEALIAAKPETVASALRAVSTEMASRFIADARRLRSLTLQRAARRNQ